MRAPLPLLVPLLLALAALPAAAASASALDLTLSASVKSWEGDSGDGNSAALLGVRLGGEAEAGGWTFTLDGSGRVATLDRETRPSDQDENRLYLLSLTAEREGSPFSLTLGRQAVSDLIGIRVFDGVEGRLELGDASLRARYGTAADVGGGTPTGTTGWGVGGAFSVLEGMTVTADYDRAERDGKLQTETAAAGWEYRWFRFTRAHLDLVYDLVSETFRDTAAGVRLYFSDKVTFGWEREERVQTFEATDIYAVFAAESAKTTTWSLLLAATPTLRYHWDYGLDSYQGGGEGTHNTVGARWIPSWGTLDLDVTYTQSDLGELTEAVVNAAYQALPSLRLGAGVELTWSDQREVEAMDGWRVHAGTDWTLLPGTTLSARVERSDDSLTEGAWAGRLSLTQEY